MTNPTGLFKPAQNEQAFLKAAIFGFAGTGKSYTSTLIARGLAPLTKGPVVYVDSENGSDYFVDDFKADGIEFLVLKTRAFQQLVRAMEESERIGASVLIIDSVSHFWEEIVDAYVKAKKRTFMQFEDWKNVKTDWRKNFTERFLNLKNHTIMNGRAGYEYDYFENESGKRELSKTGTKMKAEGELGFEPSLLVEMIREPREQRGTAEVAGTLYDHKAVILKDRTRRIHGKEFLNPTFKDFRPVVDFLNLGGEHRGAETSHSSAGMFAGDGSAAYEIQRQRKILMEELEEELLRAHPSTSAAEKKAKGDLLEKFFGSRSWLALDQLDLATLRSGYETMRAQLRGESVNESAST